jgi:hypothetical protein
VANSLLDCLPPIGTGQILSCNNASLNCLRPIAEHGL